MEKKDIKDIKRKIHIKKGIKKKDIEKKRHEKGIKKKKILQ